MLEVIKTLLFVIVSVITSTYVNVKLSQKKICFKTKNMDNFRNNNIFDFNIMGV